MLDKATMIAAMERLFEEMEARAATDNPITASEFANREADIIEAYITSATVVVDNFVSAPVATPAGPGTMSGIAKGTLQ
jgi:hypothetical protein